MVPLVVSPVAGSVLSNSAKGHVVRDGTGMSMRFFMMSEKRASLPPIDSVTKVVLPSRYPDWTCGTSPELCSWSRRLYVRAPVKIPLDRGHLETGI